MHWVFVIGAFLLVLWLPAVVGSMVISHHVKRFDSIDADIDHTERQVRHLVSLVAEVRGHQLKPCPECADRAVACKTRKPRGS